jgi:antitoxin component YwqK of YwqJK toxin-antitoxin module
LKNGQLDGELKLLTADNDQFGSLNYKNGKLDGSFLLYSNNHKLTAVFKEGILIDNLQISRVSFPGADEYESEIQLSQTTTGELLEGIYEFESSSNDPMMMYYQSKKEKWVTTAVGNGNYKTDLFANDVLYETRTQKNEYVTQTDIYFNGFLSHTKYYTDSARLQDSKILVLRDLMNGADYFHSNLSRFRSVDLNLAPWEFDPYPAITLNFVQNYVSENIPYYFKKYYPTGLVSREGQFEVEYQLYFVLVKQGTWKYYDYEGRKIRQINYQDSVVKVGGKNFDVTGSVTEFDSLGKVISERFLLEEIEHYECSNDDYYSERQYIIVSSTNPDLKNGFVRNYYDNGALMNEGKMVNGVPDGLWKFYTPDGKLGRLGSYVSGQKNGKWLTGDLSEKAYIGDVCIDPNNPDYDVVLHNLEEDKEIKVDIYKMGALLNGKVYSEMGNTQRLGSNTF